MTTASKISTMRTPQAEFCFGTFVGLFLCLFFTGLTGCTRGSSLVAEVGTMKITEEDVALRQKVIQVYNPSEKRSLGKKQLIDAYTMAEVLRLWGMPISKDELLAEKDRMMKATMMPKKLAAIRKIFDNEEDFLKIFVLPALAKRKIYYDFFLRSEKVHEETLRQAKSYLAKLIEEKADFVTFAKKKKKEISFLKLNSQGLTWGDAQEAGQFTDESIPEIVKKIQKKQAFNSSQSVEKWEKDIVSQLQSGQVFDKVVDDETRYLVVRLYKKMDLERGHIFQTVAFKKRDYSEWLKQQKQKIRIKTYD
jgi:hypothetical protein